MAIRSGVAHCVHKHKTYGIGQFRGGRAKKYVWHAMIVYKTKYYGIDTPMSSAAMSDNNVACFLRRLFLPHPLSKMHDKRPHHTAHRRTPRPVSSSNSPTRLIHHHLLAQTKTIQLSPQHHASHCNAIVQADDITAVCEQAYHCQ